MNWNSGILLLSRKTLETYSCGMEFKKMREKNTTGDYSWYRLMMMACIQYLNSNFWLCASQPHCLEGRGGDHRFMKVGRY